MKVSYDSAAAYNTAAPGRELPVDVDDIQHIFADPIEGPDGTEFCLDFAPEGLDAAKHAVGNLVLRPWAGDGRVIVLAADVRRERVNLTSAGDQTRA